jgi:hypothetical protein
LITFVVGPHRGHDEQAKPPWRFSVNLNSNCFPYAIVKEPSVYLVCPALSADRTGVPFVPTAFRRGQRPVLIPLRKPPIKHFSSNRAQNPQNYPRRPSGGRPANLVRLIPLLARP